MKFLIAGLGSIGRRHLRNLCYLGEQDIVLYRTHQATLPEDELTNFPVYSDLGRALDLKPNAVIIANPTALHLDIAIPAAKAGCAIFLEKPISDSSARLDELAATAKNSGSRILVGFQFRFHPSLQKAAELINTGAIGKVLSAHAHWGEYLPNWHPWEDYRQSYAAREDLGGGVIRTLTHPFDYIRWLAGDVDSVWSFNDHISPLKMNVEDAAEIGLRFANGAIGSIHLNYIQRPPVHWLEVIGTQGTIRWDNTDGTLHFYHTYTPFGTWTTDPAVAEEEQFFLPKDFERNSMFLKEMQHFIAVARGESEPICKLEDGKRALEIALAAVSSNREMKIQTVSAINGEA